MEVEAAGDAPVVDLHTCIDSIHSVFQNMQGDLPLKGLGRRVLDSRYPNCGTRSLLLHGASVHVGRLFSFALRSGRKGELGHWRSSP